MTVLVVCEHIGWTWHHTAPATAAAVAGGAAVLAAAPWAVRHSWKVLVGTLVAGALLAALDYWVADFEQMTPVWTAPADHPAGARAVGDWLDGGLVVRARSDQVVAYRVATGAVAWRWSPPGTDVVCAMSRETGSGTGLVGYAHQEDPCLTAAAVNLATGTTRWTARLADPQDDTVDLAEGPGRMAVAGDVAVLHDARGWYASGLSDGHTRWRAPSGPGCMPLIAGGGPGVVVTVDRCPHGAPRLTVMTAATGHIRWQAGLPVAGDLDHLAILSTAPVTVWTDEHATRGLHAVLSYGDDGRLRARIPLSQSDMDLRIPLTDLPDIFPVRPAYGAVTVGDTLVTSSEKPGDIHYSRDAHGPVRTAKGRLVAFSLTTGARLWTSPLDDHANGIAADGGGVWALTIDNAVRVDAATGHRTDSYILRDVWQVDQADLWHNLAGYLVIVCEDGTKQILEENAPVRVLH
ncbi:PQQ-binding-like beta-propeller repeat protein [Streptomyces sp. NPDC006654]|uniref:outer membrane protein assembly factor BamB family protein n=1 Tax=Streptomyces sp. NPDC006654 TaxID=3156897 RepID=UPI0033E076DE